MWSYREALSLNIMCNQVNAYGSDAKDEFTVCRENGKKQGIFKTWAVPVIPFLDAGNIDILETLWPHIVRLSKKISFQEVLVSLTKMSEPKIGRLAHQAIATIDYWEKKCTEQPTRLAASLERARLYSWILDRRLTKLFEAEPLSDKIDIRISQIVNRLWLAFGLMNPFYNLEAVVDDPLLLGVKNVEVDELSGRLDGVAILLPAAFREAVVTSALNWNGLNWEKVYKLSEKMLANPRYKKILINLSRIAEVPPQHIIFAANVLNWVPTRVGGKKSDKFPTSDALSRLEQTVTLPNPSQNELVAVLSEMNARIRFMNWIPLFEETKNFQGLSWTYASVCDTSGQLLQTLTEHPEMWACGFAKIFPKILQPQLKNLDAFSAKGRFLLHLILVEGKLKKSCFNGLDAKWQKKMVRNVIRYNDDIDEVQKPTHIIYPSSMVGCKPFGLSLAKLVIGQKKIPSGFVITTNEVENFLRENPQIWKFIRQLDLTKEIHRKKNLTGKIERAIKLQTVPKWLEKIIIRGLNQFPKSHLWAIRSSSLDEGEARGIYETTLRVPKHKCIEAVKNCIASLYSQKAMSFRKIRNESDMPRFAVLLQPYFRAEGGIAEIKPKRNGAAELHVSVGKTAAKVTSAKPILSEWNGSKNTDMVPSNLTEIVETTKKLNDIYGPIQIEWARKDNGLFILQMEHLPAVSSPIETEKVATRSLEIKSLSHLKEIANSLNSHSEFLALILNPINLESFQKKLFEILILFGRRIAEIRLSQRISPSCHIANICRIFGIRLITP